MPKEVSPKKKFKIEERFFMEKGPPDSVTRPVNEENGSRESGFWSRGRGGFQRGRGGIGRGRGGYEGGRGNYGRGRGGYERGRGDVGRGSTGFQRGPRGFIRGRGGHERGRGGHERGRGRHERGRGGHERGRGGHERGRGGFARGRGGFKTEFGGNRRASGGGQERFEEIPTSVKNLPLFRLADNLRGFALEEFDGWLFDNLFYFLDNLFLASFISSDNETSWDTVDVSRAGVEKNQPDAKKSLWKKLMQSLSPPTLKESLSSCKEYICKDLGIEKWRNENPEWPKYHFSPTMVLKEEVASALGMCPLPPRTLYETLDLIERNVLTCKYLDGRKKFYVRAADFFKKNPDRFPWKEEEVEKIKDIKLQVD